MNKKKQRVAVFSPFWAGGIKVVVSPPGNTSQAVTAACRIVNKTHGLDLSYIHVVNVARLVWGDELPTKASLKEEVKKAKEVAGVTTPRTRRKHAFADNTDKAKSAKSQLDLGLTPPG